jgi:ribosome-associated protein
VSSRVTLWFDVINSAGLTAEQKELVLRRLRTRIGKDGVLRVISQQTRSQAENKELAVERFVELIQDALRKVPVRKKTRVSKGAKLRRLEEKRQRSVLKGRGRKEFPSKIRQKETLPTQRVARMTQEVQGTVVGQIEPLRSRLVLRVRLTACPSHPSFRTGAE